MPTILRIFWRFYFFWFSRLGASIAVYLMSGFDFGNLLSIARCLFLIMVSIIARCLLSIALMVSIIISIFFFWKCCVGSLPVSNLKFVLQFELQLNLCASICRNLPVFFFFSTWTCLLWPPMDSLQWEIQAKRHFSQMRKGLTGTKKTDL